MASANGHAGIVHLLLDAGAVRAAAGGCTAWWHGVCTVTAGCMGPACRSHLFMHRNTICWFLVQVPDKQNTEGNTPLHWACLNGRKEVGPLLAAALATCVACCVVAICLKCIITLCVTSVLPIVCMQVVQVLVDNGASPTVLNRWGPSTGQQAACSAPACWSTVDALFDKQQLLTGAVPPCLLSPRHRAAPTAPPWMRRSTGMTRWVGGVAGRVCVSLTVKPPACVC